MMFFDHPNLLEAFEEYVRVQDALLPDEEALASITFSERFQERMRRMIRRHRYGYYVLFGTAGRRAASIIVALLVAFTVATVSVEALRKPVAQFFAEVFEKFTMIFVTDEAPASRMGEMELHAPTYVPEGYEIESEIELDGVYHILFSNADGDTIKYSQRQESVFSVNIDTEKIQYSEIVAGDNQGIIYVNKNITYIVLWNSQYCYSLSGTISADELTKIAESIKN